MLLEYQAQVFWSTARHVQGSLSHHCTCSSYGMWFERGQKGHHTRQPDSLKEGGTKGQILTKEVHMPLVPPRFRHLLYNTLQYTYRMRSADILAHGLFTLRSRAVSSEAKKDFRVNSCLLSSNKYRLHLSTYITHWEGRKRWC